MAANDSPPLLRRHAHAHSHIHRHHHRDSKPESLLDLGPVPTIPEFPSPVELVKRASSTCKDSTSKGCELPQSSMSNALPIALSVTVPLTIAFVILFVIHRRHQKKVRREEAMDKHKSLDFGMDAAAIGKSGKKAKKGQKGQQEMADANAEQRRLQRDLHRGQMSMDMDLAMDMSNPYILPPEIHNSRESLHSLSRTVVHGAHDPYRPATFAPSLKGSQFGDDASSIRTGSTHQTNGFGRDGMNQNLLRNAQRMSRSGPPPPVRSPDSMSEIHSQTSSPPLPAKSLARGQMRNMSDGSAAPISELPKSPESAHSQPPRVASPQSYELPRVASPQSHEPPRRTSSNQQPINQQPQHVQQPSNNYYYQGPAPMGMSLDGQNMRPHQMGSPPRQKGLAEIAAQEFSTNGQNPAEFKEIVVPPPPNAMSRSPQGQNGHLSPEIQGGSTPFFTPTEQYDNQQSYYEDTPYQQDSHYQQQQQQQQQHQGFDNGIVHGLGVTDADFDTRRLSIMRPLPPDDPSDNAEQRANRIRSFYKEYFSDDQPAKAYVPNNAEYYEDYGSEYLGDGTIFDPETGRFVVAGAPYAEPVTRRAMTPPPRGPPRFRGNAGHMHTGSAGPMSPGSPMGPGPRSRAFSSASTSRMGPSPRGAPRKNLPPPQALRTVPTPHLLKEGDFMLPIDFAPPSGFKERLQGRPNSPLGVMRPYSPSVAVANPLASSYNDLPSMPSPHQLRKSGLFTALDFAPPPRFKDRDGTASDAGSIRSARSNGSSMSALHQQSIRNGAYRVSKIPKGLVATQQEFSESLKPTWKVGS